MIDHKINRMKSISGRFGKLAAHDAVVRAELLLKERRYSEALETLVGIISFYEICPEIAGREFAILLGESISDIVWIRKVEEE